MFIFVGVTVVVVVVGVVVISILDKKKGGHKGILSGKGEAMC